MTLTGGATTVEKQDRIGKDAPRTKLVLLGGFLGSGKTTLMVEWGNSCY